MEKYDESMQLILNDRWMQKPFPTVCPTVAVLSVTGPFVKIDLGTAKRLHVPRKFVLGRKIYGGVGTGTTQYKQHGNHHQQRKCRWELECTGALCLQDEEAVAMSIFAR